TGVQTCAPPISILVASRLVTLVVVISSIIVLSILNVLKTIPQLWLSVSNTVLTVLHTLLYLSTLTANVAISWLLKNKQLAIPSCQERTLQSVQVTAYH